MAQFGVFTGSTRDADPLSMSNSRQRSWNRQDERDRQQKEEHDARMREASIRQKAMEDAEYEKSQNEFAQRFGRGLTDGSASRRGAAGQRTNVPPGAMYQPPEQTQTYWNQGDARTGRGNTVAAQGELARAAQGWIDATGDKTAQNAAKQNLIKAYNDSPFSSVTDATDIEFDADGNMKFKVGDQYINNKPVSIDDFRRIGEANNLMDQSVFQRKAGTVMGVDAQGLQPIQSKSSVKAAEVVGGAEIDKWKSEIKRLSDRAEMEKMTPELQAEINHARTSLDNAVMQAGKSIYGAGLPPQGQGQGQRGTNPVNDLKQLIDINRNASDTEIREAMWNRYGDHGVMRVVEDTLAKRAQDIKNTGGLKQPGQNTDVPIGLKGQPDLKLGSSKSTGAGGLQPKKQMSNFQQRYADETKVEQEKLTKEKAQGDVAMKVRRMYDNMRTVRNLTPADADYLQSVYQNPNASAKVKKEAYDTYKRYRDLQNK